MRNILKNAFVRKPVFVGNITRIALSVGLGAYDLEGALALFHSRDQRVDAVSSVGRGALVDFIDFARQLVQVRREQTTTTDTGKACQHLGGDVRCLKRAGGRKRFVEKYQTMLGDQFKNIAQTSAFFAKTSFVNGIVGARREVREIPSEMLISAASAGTNKPSCNRASASPNAQVTTDLPPRFGPVRT